MACATLPQKSESVAISIAQACGARGAIALCRISRPWSDALFCPQLWQAYLTESTSVPYAMLCDPCVTPLFCGTAVHPSHFRSIVAAIVVRGWPRKFAALRRCIERGKLSKPYRQKSQSTQAIQAAVAVAQAVGMARERRVDRRHGLTGLAPRDGITALAGSSGPIRAS